MEIIGKTKDGVLINASSEEVKEILNSVTGKRPEVLEIGQKIPAIDYASTITKVRALSDNSNYKEILRETERFAKHVSILTKAVEATKDIQL